MRLPLVLGVLALAIACKSKQQEAQPEAKQAEPLVTSDAAVARPAPEEPLPARPDPPKPFDRLRPLMKQADALAALADAGARTASRFGDVLWPDDVVVYETAIPGTIGYLAFHDGRLHWIAIAHQGGEWLRNHVVGRWGQGSVKDTGLLTTHEYPASTTGWSASVRHVGGRGYSELQFAARSLDTGGTIAVTEKVFADLARLVGGPLDAAVTELRVRRETSDDDDKAPERGVKRQGFAVVNTPWSPRQFQLVLRTDTTEQITSATLTGTIVTETGRIELFAALRKAFGAPKATVSPAGRLEIEYSSGALVITSSEERDNELAITIRRR